MPVAYQVTIEATNTKGTFRITWYNIAKNSAGNFDQSTIEIAPDEANRLWQKLPHQLAIGKRLFHFLDGNARHLQRALDETAREGESLQLYLRACQEVADLPFELLAQDSTFLLPNRLHLVRRVSDWGANRTETPKDRPLKLLFMACSALDVEPELDFEREEEAIFKVTEKLAIDMEVEDSGSLEGLRDKLEQDQYDIVHLSGHANIDEHGRPYFVMENEIGKQHDVFPSQLWQDALIENPTRLLFLSGCRTGEVPDTIAAVSFARQLVERYQVPAVLGWGRSVSDEQATHAEKTIYHELSRGRTILEAVQRARNELIENFALNQHPAWPLLRLFSSGPSLNAIVKKGQRARPQPRRLVHTYLKQSQVQVLAEGFVGRRRQLQQSLRALKHDTDKVGVLLHGIGGLGKSCLAGKISERFSNYTLIIVHGKLNAITLNHALTDAFLVAGDEAGKQLLDARKEMPEKLARLCTTSFKESNYLLLLDDFEQNLEGAAEGSPGYLVPEAAELMKVLLHYLPFAGKMSQVMITSRYPFSLTEQGRNLVEQNLAPISLTSFQLAEQRKKARELKNKLNYPDISLIPQLVAAGHGNPRFMEWLDRLVGEMSQAKVSRLLTAIRDKQEEFIRKHVIRELLALGGNDFARLLRWLSIFRRPVPYAGVEKIGEKAGINQWQRFLNKGVQLSLAEYDQARETYQVTPLLREELLQQIDNPRPCHKAAFAYYQGICEACQEIDPILTEEWIYHALGCDEEDVAARQGGMLVTFLRNHLAYQESKRVGEWILTEKKRALSSGDDAFLLNALAGMVNALGEHRKAINYYEQSLKICPKVYGDQHSEVAIRLNNLGEVWRVLGEPKKAIGYYEQALAIDRVVYGDQHPDVAIDLNNPGLAWFDLGDNKKAIGYYEQALAIDRAVYGDQHPAIAYSFNNLGSAYFELGQREKAKGYFEEAYTIFERFFG